MSNVGPNSGSKLRYAASKFTNMLMMEIVDITGLTYPEIDRALKTARDHLNGFHPTVYNDVSLNCYRYSLYCEHPLSKVPRASRLQSLEEEVAYFLGRKAHPIVLKSQNRRGDPYGDIFCIEGSSGEQNLNLRQFHKYELSFAYGDNWPTYGELKQFSTFDQDTFSIHELIEREDHNGWLLPMRLFSWQWECLWSKGLPWLSCNKLELDDALAYKSILRLTNSITKNSDLMGWLDQLIRYPECHLKNLELVCSNYDDYILGFLFGLDTNAAWLIQSGLAFPTPPQCNLSDYWYRDPYEALPYEVIFEKEEQELSDFIGERYADNCNKLLRQDWVKYHQN